MSSNVREMRREVQGLMGDVRRLIPLLNTANMSLATTIGYMRMMGLPEEMEDAMVIVQTFIITIETLRMVLRALEIEMGPAGWALILAGLIGTIGLSHEMQMRRTRY